LTHSSVYDIINNCNVYSALLSKGTDGLLDLQKKSKEVTIVKEGIHPEFKKTTITCHCGNVIETMSTKENIKVEICSKCHPFYTGKQKLVDTGGRVDRFKKRFNMDK
jgi:large subunit ribosomal protein L31